MTMTTLTTTRVQSAASKFGFGRKMCHMVPGTLLHGGNYKSANLRSCKKPTICRMDGEGIGTTLLQRHTLAGSLFGVLVCHIVGLL